MEVGQWSITNDPNGIASVGLDPSKDWTLETLFRASHTKSNRILELCRNGSLYQLRMAEDSAPVNPMVILETERLDETIGKLLQILVGNGDV